MCACTISFPHFQWEIPAEVFSPLKVEAGSQLISPVVVSHPWGSSLLG